MNKQLEHLANYVDNDLGLILSDDQRDEIISRASAALTTDDRVQTRKQKGEALLNAVHRVTPTIVTHEPKKQHGWLHALKVVAAVIGVIAMIVITVAFYI